MRYGTSVAKGSPAFRFRADDTWGVSPWQSRIHTAGIFVAGRSVAIGSSAYRHIAGVCVTSRNVAKSLSAFRIAR
ncbi:hypothetical protein [Desulfosporosinus sp. OT]|uniref:hypothetical protein n=1 Tax=Desulfosporosinus sp. OT TaxID=913865 RepID=UPI00111274B5|nr:hypothetical protein [Desulfosporosinus sp. OT]